MDIKTEVYYNYLLGYTVVRYRATIKCKIGKFEAVNYDRAKLITRALLILKRAGIDNF